MSDLMPPRWLLLLAALGGMFFVGLSNAPVIPSWAIVASLLAAGVIVLNVVWVLISVLERMR